MAELLLCPFCGGPGWHWTNERGFSIIECRDCPGRIAAQDKETAIAAWNRRTSSPQVGDAEREELAREVDSWAGRAAFGRKVAAKRRRIAALLRAPAPQPQDDGWRDISAAPKDGRRVMVCNDESPDDMDTASWFEDGWYSADGLQHPTHWRPLPAPPVRKDGDG